MFKNYLTTAYRHLRLQQYPFRIGNGWIVLICFLSGLLASVVVVMTVGSQAWSVARANPIKAIRHE